MKINIIKHRGDVFANAIPFLGPNSNSPTIIGHGTNAYGVMGSGIAVTVREKFPLVYQAYRDLCLRNKNNVNDFGGGCHLVSDDGSFEAHELLTQGTKICEASPLKNNSILIANIFSQVKPGKNAHIAYVAEGFNSLFFLLKFVKLLEVEDEANYHINIPAIGCGIGGLKWPDVEQAIKNVSDGWSGPRKYTMNVHVFFLN